MDMGFFERHSNSESENAEKKSKLIQVGNAIDPQTGATHDRLTCRMGNPVGWPLLHFFMFFRSFLTSGEVVFCPFFAVLLDAVLVHNWYARNVRRASK